MALIEFRSFCRHETERSGAQRTTKCRRRKWEWYEEAGPELMAKDRRKVCCCSWFDLGSRSVGRSVAVAIAIAVVLMKRLRGGGEVGRRREVERSMAGVELRRRLHNS